MGWTAHRTNRNTLHVINDEDGSHFEAENEEVVNDTIAAIQATKDEEARQAAERDANAGKLTSVVGDVPTPRGN